jgi:hypothetical protein
MKKSLVTIVMLFLVASIAGSQTTQRKVLCRILNPQVAASNYSFEIWAKNDSVETTFPVGNCDFYFSYNSNALNTPTLTNINPKYTGVVGVDNYDPMHTAIVGEKLQVGIRWSGSSGGSSLLSTTTPDGERICQVNLNITQPSQTSNLSWDTQNTAMLTTGSSFVIHTLQGSDNRPLPVQLASFTASIINPHGHVQLRWLTLSETNNFGFYVQKSQNSRGTYQGISPLIPGHGTTLEPHEYSWIDVLATSGTWYYRLKQVDLDGTEHFSDPIQPSGLTEVAERPLPTEFELSQNYPNPFNPSTKIEIALPKQSSVRVEVYNLLGQRVAVLLDEVKPAGYHILEFNANGFSSGFYLCRMSANNGESFLRKMILMK